MVITVGAWLHGKLFSKTWDQKFASAWVFEMFAPVFIVSDVMLIIALALWFA